MGKSAKNRGGGKKGGAKGESLKEKARKRRQLEQLKERAKSEYCEARSSEIHGTGVYAIKDIPVGKKIIEYLGERIDKEESERRANAQMEHAEKTGDAAVYIFTLNKKWDLDGNMPWNTARLLNHSCAPNCEAWIEDKQIFLYSLREIAKGEELTFDYGFDIENYEDHPCLCGSDDCVGYIVGRDYWEELAARLAKKTS
ncbi:MAG: SET domain-containing protein-lysine N-methyltransferase [Roseibacillus sp.]|nr:SET domain-containing protein-lysine N-methyltransferase [Roseibacillus sp.]HAO95249.1 SET domain-containing protein-lysine N-methyltransferase [Verrucomicrobiales bacterium]|tara:strand:+ start:9824 stop:10420 length:597 start_codon:yes stop_codon:yes gene_type:complete